MREEQVPTSRGDACECWNCGPDFCESGFRSGSINVDDKDIGRIEAIVLSMTPEERRRPEIINGSRRKRIARGSGTSVQEVNRLLKDFQQMRKLFGQLRKGRKLPGMIQLS